MSDRATSQAAEDSQVVVAAAKVLRRYGEYALAQKLFVVAESIDANAETDD